jgi:hypothetical protein
MLEKEAFILQTLDGRARAVLNRLASIDPALRQSLDDAYAYVVFPSVGKASALLGCAFGKGEVFKGGGLVGYAGTVQLTLGVQLGGYTFSEIVVCKDKQSFDRFKSGRIAFAAGASAVLVKSGAAGAVNYQRGVAVFVYPEGGLTLEAALGVQKFVFRPAGMGRLKSAPRPAATRYRANERASNPAKVATPSTAARRRKPATTTKTGASNSAQKTGSSSRA